MESTFAIIGGGPITELVGEALAAAGWKKAEAIRSAGLLLVVVDAADPAGFDDLDEQRWQAMLDARLRPAVDACVAALHGMQERREGCIVLVAVDSGVGAGVHVAAADGALEGFAKALAAESAPAGIRVNLVRAADGDHQAAAETVRYLAEEGTFTTGQVLGRRSLDIAVPSVTSRPPEPADRLALVTGSTQGIGRACAARLVADGTRVAINGPSAEIVDAVALAEGAIPAAADIAVAAEVEEMVAGLEAREGPVGLLVANAAYMSMAPLAEHDRIDWWRNLDVNLTGHFRVLQAVLPGMRRRGGGHVVMVASEVGVIGMSHATAYSASKGGIVALCAALARELAPEGIAVAAVAPGAIDTAQLAVDAEAAGMSLDALRAQYASDIPLGRIGRPEELAACIAFLAGPAGSAFSGQLLQANGGSTRARP